MTIWGLTSIELSLQTDVLLYFMLSSPLSEFVLGMGGCVLVGQLYKQIRYIYSAITNHGFKGISFICKNNKKKDKKIYCSPVNIFYII